MNSPEIPDTIENAASEYADQNTREEIQYSLDLNFRSVDGNFEILLPADRNLSDADIAQGLGSRQEKINISFARLLEGLPMQLHDLKKEIPEERKTIVQSLLEKKPTFISLNKDKVDRYFIQASDLFADNKPGVILLPETGSVMNQISAIEYFNGHLARMLQAKKRQNLESFVEQANFLTPALEARQLDDNTDAYAMEFLRQGERPKEISPAEMTDWLDRVKQSGLIFGFDVAEKNDKGGLDNFIRKDGKLFWIDGNILKAETPKDEQELDLFVEKQKQILSTYLQR